MTAPKKPDRRLSAEERRLVSMYRAMPSRWEKNAVFLIVQGLAWSGLTESTNGVPWSRLCKVIGLPAKAQP